MHPGGNQGAHVSTLRFKRILEICPPPPQIFSPSDAPVGSYIKKEDDDPSAIGSESRAPLCITLTIKIWVVAYLKFIIYFASIKKKIFNFILCNLQ